MIEVFGPTYRYNREILTTPEIIYILDHHYDEDGQCFHVKTLLENSTCDPKKHVLIFNHVVKHEDQLQEYQCLCLPIFMSKEANEFNQQNIKTNWNNKTHTFNFMINKPRLHREFLLMLVEYFELDNYCHTLAWQHINFNRTSLKKYTSNRLYHDIIESTSVNIEQTDYKFGPEEVLSQGIKNGNFKNAETYQHLLQKSVFEPSCISLITEPAFFQKETIHTEKTIMAIYGGTLPIWVGGWRQADYMKSLGFDVFDDVIDHSYQDMPDPFDRCYYAVERNIELLKNFDRVSQFIAKNQDRLQHNIKLIENNVFLTNCVAKINQYTGSERSVLCSLVPLIQPSLFANYRAQAEYQLLGTIT
jgi:hypothetical protein